MLPALPVHPGFTTHSSIPSYSIVSGHRLRWRDYLTALSIDCLPLSLWNRG